MCTFPRATCCVRRWPAVARSAGMPQLLMWVLAKPCSVISRPAEAQLACGTSCEVSSVITCIEKAASGSALGRHAPVQFVSVDTKGVGT